MKLIATNVSETAVYMRFADDGDPTKASEWIEFQVPIAPLKIDEHNLLGEPARRTLGALRRAALYHVQAALSEADREIAAAIRR